MIPVLVLVPGLQSAASSWHSLIDRLGNSWPLSIPMGHQFAEDTAKMAESVLHQSPARFHLVGWSMGGYVALEILHRAPERLLSLTLMATSARAEASGNRPRRAAAVERARTQGLSAYQAANLDECFHDPSVLSEEMRERLLATAQALGVDALERQTRAIQSRKDRRDTLATCPVPVLIVAGVSDRVVPPGNATEMHRLAPGSVLHMLDECGHCPPHEKIDKAAAIIDDFLRNTGKGQSAASEISIP